MSRQTSAGIGKSYGGLERAEIASVCPENPCRCQSAPGVSFRGAGVCFSGKVITDTLPSLSR